MAPKYKKRVITVTQQHSIWQGKDAMDLYGEVLPGNLHHRMFRQNFRLTKRSTISHLCQSLKMH